MHEYTNIVRTSTEAKSTGSQTAVGRFVTAVASVVTTVPLAGNGTRTVNRAGIRTVEPATVEADCTSGNTAAT